MRILIIIAAVLASAPVRAEPAVTATGTGVAREAVSTAFSSTEGVDSILAEVSKAEKGLKDVAFNFVQRTALKGTGETQEVTGEVRMLRSPERFRVDYTSPVRQVAIYDGKNLLLYLPEVGQAFRQKASLAELEKMIGFNPAQMMEAFSGGYTPELKGCQGGKCALVFRPGDLSRTSWNVVLSSGTWLVDEVSFENSDMIMSIKCSGYMVNSGMTAGKFRFKLPPGTEVLDGIPMLMQSAPSPKSHEPAPAKGGKGGK